MASEIHGADDRSADAAAAPPAGSGDLSSASPSSVLVLGMHRSGTSAVTRLLGMTGLDMGEADAMLPAHASDNPAGYWERADINAINDALLEARGFAWNRIAGLDAADAAAPNPEADEHIAELVAHFTSRCRAWVIKDPRLCLTLEHWLPRLRDPVCVVVVRDPREIATSMATGRAARSPPRSSSRCGPSTCSACSKACVDAARFSFPIVASSAILRGQCRRMVHGLRDSACRVSRFRPIVKSSAFVDRDRRRSRLRRTSR